MAQQIDVSKHLKKYRLLAKFTGKEVANLIGIEPGTYGSYEEGRSFPPFQVLLQLRNLYGLRTVESFIEGTEPIDSVGTIYSRYARLSAEKKKIVDLLLSST